MAIMFPDNIPQKASQGEKTLFSIFRDNLPDDFLCWYEADINNLHPDFIVLAPTFGLLIIEVKGWYANSIIKGDKNYFLISENREGKEQHKSYQHPLRQSRSYFTEIVNKLNQYSILIQSNENYQGKLIFPIGYGAVMSNITKTQAEEENIYPLLEAPQVAYRDELLTWNEFSDSQLIKRLKEMFTTKFNFMALTDEQINTIQNIVNPELTKDQLSTIKGILHPETVVKVEKASENSVKKGVLLEKNSEILQTLDVQQEKIARQIGSGHRVFSGVVGSGKTLILLSRAKYLASLSEENNILILCFNITLAAYLRSLIYEDNKNIQYKKQILILHFHDWAKEILGRLPIPQSNNFDDNYNEGIGKKILINLKNTSEKQKWNAILVDEAHTFYSSWLESCVQALKDPENGDLMIVYDRSQTLYKRPKFTWNLVGVKAQGRSRILRTNYRNTAEILSVAWNLIDSISENETEVEESINFPIVKPNSALRHGKAPVLYWESSPQQEIIKAIKLIKDLTQEKYKPEDIAILYRNLYNKDPGIFEDLINKLNEANIKPYWVTQNNETKRQYNIYQPGVRILTSLSSLGLEFKVVIIIWIQQFANCYSSNVEVSNLEKRQLYVAMTRAEEELYLFGSGNTKIIQELKKQNGITLA